MITNTLAGACLLACSRSVLSVPKKHEKLTNDRRRAQTRNEEKSSIHVAVRHVRVRSTELFF